MEKHQQSLAAGVSSDVQPATARKPGGAKDKEEEVSDYNLFLAVAFRMKSLKQTFKFFFLFFQRWKIFLNFFRKNVRLLLMTLTKEIIFAK